MSGPRAAILLVPLVLVAAGCRYERLPEHFELPAHADQPGLSVSYSEAMRDPTSMRFPPVTVRLFRVDNLTSTPTSAPAPAPAPGTPGDAPESELNLEALRAQLASIPPEYVLDLPLHQRQRTHRLDPGHPILQGEAVFVAAAVPWAAPPQTPANLVEREGLIDDEGRELSPFVAQPPPDDQATRPDRRSALLRSATVRSRGIVLEIDREGVRVLPSGLRLNP